MRNFNLKTGLVSLVVILLMVANPGFLTKSSNPYKNGVLGFHIA